MKLVCAAVVVASALLSACASESIKEAAFEGLYARECLQKSGMANCNPDKPTYEEYKHQREEYLKK